MLVELPSGKEDFGIGEPVGEEDFGSFNDLVGGDEPLVHVGMQRGREALAATVAVFQIALLVESSVSSQDPPEADKSDGQKALEEAFEIAIEVAEDFLALLRTEGEQFAIGASHEPPQNAGPGWLLDIEAGGRVRNVGLPQPLVVYAVSEESALGHDLLGKIIDGLREGRKAGTPDLLPKLRPSARLLRRLDRVDEARLAYERALELVSSDAERRFLERRLAGLQPR